MRPKRNFIWILRTFAITVTLLPVAGALAIAEEPAAVATDELQQTLDWMDRYLTVQVLFDQQDVLKLRDKVARMSPDDLQAWLDRTKELRERLESPEWVATQEFLADFLAKQAIYSDEEIAQMRKEAAEMEPDQLMGLLDKMEAKYAEMTGRRLATEQRREAGLAGQDLRVARQQDAAKEQQKVMYSARDRYLSNQAAQARSASSRSSTPLFGSNQSNAARSSARSKYRPPAPLVDSRDAARRAVHGGYRWGW